MIAYYNEHDKYAAAWLRNLINAGHIAPGIVDDRSIEDVQPNDLTGFTQCHFFAGVGVWSYALRAAGWDDSRPVWTGSCPCQPFSAAGAGAGFADERHLWPAFHHLITECRPAIVFGEQVAGSVVEPWVDLVHADMEALDYTFGCIPFPSAGVGAPHIRDRLYWVANASSARSSEQFGGRFESARLAASRASLRLGNPSRTGLDQRVGVPGIPGGTLAGITGQALERTSVHVGGMAHATGDGQQRGRASEAGNGCHATRIESERLRDVGERPGPTNGFWRDADWLGCRDGRWRAVEPGTFPLAHGATDRVGRLRAYGNAINAEAARLFVEAVIAVVD